MSKHLDHITYIEPLKSKDSRRISKTLEKINICFYPNILEYIKQNHGVEADAEDVFQEVLFALFRISKNEDFILKKALKNLLFILSRNIWLKKLQKKGKKEVTFPNEAVLNNISSDEDILKNLENSIKRKFVLEKFKQLSGKCQAILKLYIQNKSMNEIAETLGYNNRKTARNRKYECVQNLKKLIQSDSRYDELK